MDLLKIGLIFTMLELCRAVGDNTTTCPDNEIPKCESACAPTCQNRNISQVCTHECIGPCSCKKGYIREGPGGMCVPESCKGVLICKKFEKFVSCPSTCPRICDQIPKRFCAKICLRVGCVCEDGYVRETQGGKCIPECKCNQKCDDNESYSNCGSGCPGTCELPARDCGEGCFQGCFCNEGYVFDENTFKCIKKGQCPKAIH